MEETRRLWNAWSDDFQAAWNAATEEGGVPPAPVHYGPGYPADERLALLPDLDGADAVELGCGGGQGAIGLARHGADVVGVDLSVEQLRHARRHRAVHGVDVRLVAGDVRALPLPADRFDLAYSAWTFQLVDDLAAAVEEAARVLRPGGVLVLAVPHPVFALFDEATGARERSYFDETPERKSVGDCEPDLTVHHRTVAAYHDALVEAGFVVDRLVEPGSDDPDDYADHANHDPELMAAVPPTLVLRGRNAAATGGEE